MVFASKHDIDLLKARIDQLDADMAAIAQAINLNNKSTKAILDAIEASKRTPMIVGLDS